MTQRYLYRVAAPLRKETYEAFLKIASRRNISPSSFARQLIERAVEVELQEEAAGPIQTAPKTGPGPQEVVRGSSGGDPIE